MFLTFINNLKKKKLKNNKLTGKKKLKITQNIDVRSENMCTQQIWKNQTIKDKWIFETSIISDTTSIQSTVMLPYTCWSNTNLGNLASFYLWPVYIYILRIPRIPFSENAANVSNFRSKNFFFLQFWCACDYEQQLIEYGEFP